MIFQRTIAERLIGERSNNKFSDDSPMTDIVEWIKLLVGIAGLAVLG
jgi:hypothetical protein